MSDRVGPRAFARDAAERRARRGRVHRTISGAIQDFVNVHPEALAPGWGEVPPGETVSKFQLSAEKRLAGSIIALLKREGVL